MRARLLAALCGLLLVVAGCAAIPTETVPGPVNIDLGQGGTPAVPEPEPGLSPSDIVRGFVDNTADSTGDYAAAGAYLADSARSSWDGGASVTIISTDFGTIATPGADPNTQTVTVRGALTGTLNSDGSFTGRSGVFQTSYQVTRQRDGQWRIVHPQNGVVIPYKYFQINYHQVPIYYFDPTGSQLVPDLRWVASEPVRALPARIVDALLAGPSAAMRGAVMSAIPGDVTPKTTVEETDDGAILVNLDNVPDEPDHTKQLMVAQIVASLHADTDGLVRIETEANPLVPGHRDWRYSELPLSYQVTSPSANLPGLMVARERVYSLKDDTPVPGQAGNGSFAVQTAAQSVDGSELALVVSLPGSGEALRVGKFGSTVSYVDLNAQHMTRPTWAPGDAAGDPSHEVWTVADGQVVRVDNNVSNGVWQATPVDSSALAADGPITDLRLSRDGTRVAVVAGGHLFVGAVVATEQGSVAIKQVTQLQPDILAGVTGVDWLDQTDLVVTTAQASLPVVKLSVDGLVMEPYLATNLTEPVTAVTGAPSRPVIVSDATGLWRTSDTTEIWQSVSRSDGASMVPFYPG